MGADPLAVCIPCLDEDPALLARALDTVSRLDVDLIIVVDGGTSRMDLDVIAQICETCPVPTSLRGAVVTALPNKNLAVAVAVHVAGSLGDSAILAVIDADLFSIDYYPHLRRLLKAIEDVDIVVPEPQLTAGRDNRLVGGPMLRLMHRELYAVVHNPFPGMLLGRLSVLGRVTANIDYHYDWGGEWDLVVRPHLAGARVSAPHIPVHEVRHRTMRSKIVDAFQLWRAGLLIAASQQFGGLGDTNQLRSTLQTYDQELDDWERFAASGGGLRSLDDLVNHLAGANPPEIAGTLADLSQRTGRLEWAVIHDMVAVPVALLTTATILQPLIPGPPLGGWASLDARGITLACDVVATALLAQRSRPDEWAELLRHAPVSEWSTETVPVARTHPHGVDLLAARSKGRAEYQRIHRAARDGALSFADANRLLIDLASSTHVGV
ncbi:MAG: hypothetical protein M1546_18395 [Chloroflexi bacterium]|nr:hypothetical protein [Chloroflexota bacterium]